MTMKTVTVPLKNRSYDILIGEDGNDDVFGGVVQTTFKF